MKNVYFISYTIYADGDYQQIINKGSTTMELTVSELRQLGKVHNALVHFNILDARKNGGDFRPDSDLIVIDNISKLLECRMKGKKEWWTYPCHTITLERLYNEKKNIT